jgi:hypothetical protein
MKLLVNSMGNNYFIVQGDSEIQGGFLAWFGSVRVVGNQIRISVHETHSNSKPIPTMEAENSGCQLFLDSATLNGTGWCSTASYDVEFKQGKVKYSTGTITHILCP